MTTYLENFANFTVNTTLSAGIDNSVTLISLTNGAPFAMELGSGSTPIRIRIDDEVMWMISGSGADFIVSRGKDGTSAASHSLGADVKPVLTKDGLNKRVNEGTLTITTSSSTSLTLDDTYFTLLMSNSSNSTVNLPAASSMPGRCYTIKKVGANAATITIDPNSTETIDGFTTLILYIQNDFVKIQSDGTNWIVVQDGVQAHVTRIYRNAALNAANGENTTVAFDAVAFDTGGISVIGSSNVTIKRAGVYYIKASAAISGLDDGEIIVARIMVNGAATYSSLAYSPGADKFTSALSATTLNLSAGDVVTMNFFNGEGGSQAFNVAEYKPELIVVEQRNGGHGGGARVAAFNFTSQSGSSYSAVNGDYVLCDLTSNSMTINLSASPSTNDRIGVKLSVASGTRTVTIDPSGTHEIDGQTTIVLYILNDFIEIMWDGSEWRVIADGVQPHIARMRATSAQAITGSIATFVYDTTDIDNAGLISLGSDNMTIRRGGFYETSAYFRISSVLDGGERIILNLTVNGTSENESIWYSAGTDATVAAQHHWKGMLNAGDVVTWTASQSDNAGNQNSAAVATVFPYAALCEVRGGGHGSGGAIPLSEVYVTTPGAGAAGYGTVGTQIRRYTVQKVNTGTAITFADSSTNGCSFTINENGLYAVSVADSLAAGDSIVAVSKNSASLSTSFGGLGASEITPLVSSGSSGKYPQASAVLRLSAGDVLRFHAYTTKPDSTANIAHFRIIKVGN